MAAQDTNMSFTYKHPHPAVTVDGVVFGFDETDLKLLLIQRELEPFKGKWALPGGFVRMEEDLEEAVRRELADETGITRLYLEQLYSFGDPKRDPRERVISIAYYALVKLADHKLRAASDAVDVAWFPVAELPKLAFDHEKIVEVALKRLKAKVRYEPIGFELLPEKFTLGELQQLYEIVLEQPVDKRNFRKKILGTDLLDPLDEYQQDVSHRAAQFYRFNRPRYEQLKKRGFNFEL
jgi:8-oxo-dGTP diphosphatase